MRGDVLVCVFVSTNVTCWLLCGVMTVITLLSAVCYVFDLLHRIVLNVGFVR